jgi:hypothetical protein
MGDVASPLIEAHADLKPLVRVSSRIVPRIEAVHRVPGGLVVPDVKPDTDR